MKPLHLRLAATAVLFAAWMGYLAYLVHARPLTPAGTPVVLSRPQLLVSDLDVVAQVDGVDVPVTVKEVIYDAGGRSGVTPDATLHVTNLGECHPLVRVIEKGHEVYRDGPPDFTVPGLYILPLVPAGGGAKPGTYRVTPTPPSPGFSADLPRIYPATADSRAQLAEIVARKRKDLGGP
jgi:hypothetical protein